MALRSAIARPARAAADRRCWGPRPTPSLRGQRYEFLFVARDEREAALGPVALGAFDALGGAGDEVPPDLAGTLQRITAEQQHARVAGRAQHGTLGGVEDE